MEVGKLPNHLKLFVMYSGSILLFNSPLGTEIQRAVRLDPVPILSQKNSPYILAPSVGTALQTSAL